MADYIHYDPDRILYSVSEEELNNLKDSAQPLWKDICIACTSLGIPTIINAVAETVSSKPFSINVALFLNYLFGVLGITLGIIFGIAWYKCHKKTQNLFDKIKAKPRVPLPVSTSNVGALPEPKKK